MDAPDDVFDLAGLMSPNPERHTLPLVEQKMEVKKSSAWTKEGKRQREMSTLILPRPERVTMPAAIYPNAEKRKIGLIRRVKPVSNELAPQGDTSEAPKIDTSKEASAKAAAPTTIDEISRNNFSTTVNVFTVETSSDAPIIPIATSTDSGAAKVDPALNSTSTDSLPKTPDAAQLLLQLVNLLRSDDKALHTLTTLVNAVAPDASAVSVHKVTTHLQEATEPHPAPVGDDALSKDRNNVRVEAPSFDPVAKPEKQQPQLPEPFVFEGEVRTPMVGTAPQIDSTDMKEIDISASQSEPPVLIYPMRKHPTHKYHPVERQYKSNSSKSSRSSKLLPESRNTLSTRELHKQRAFSTHVETRSAPCDQIRTIATVIRESLEDDDLAREDLWYNVPEGKRAIDFDSDEERYPASTIYTLEKLKKLPQSDKSYSSYSRNIPANPPVVNLTRAANSAFSKSPFGGSNETYERTFPKVDARDDLEIVSKPNGYNASKPSSTPDKIDINANIKGMEQTDSTASLGSIESQPSGNLPFRSNSRVSPSTPPLKDSAPSPVLYDFNPPTPHRVTHRVVHRSKEVGTQTSPHSAASSKETIVEEIDGESKHRPAAIHHPRYYNTLPRDHVSTKQKKFVPPMELTSDELAALPKGWTGSDDIWIGTQKNVDAGDEDLGIVSKPKEPEPEPELVEVSPAEETPDALAELAKRINGLEEGSLKALLKALSNAPAVEPPDADIAKKEKKDRKERKDKKEKKEKKEKRASKSEKKAARKEKKAKKEAELSGMSNAESPVVNSKHVETNSAKDRADAVKSPEMADAKENMSDIFGDLIGEEIPKWNSLNLSG